MEEKNKLKVEGIDERVKTILLAKPVPTIKIFSNYCNAEILEKLVNEFIEETCKDSLVDIQFKTNILQNGRPSHSVLIVYNKIK